MSSAGGVAWMAIYWIVFSPVALVYRLFRPDPLNLRRRQGEASYWQSRRTRRYRPMTTQY